MLIGGVKIFELNGDVMRFFHTLKLNYYKTVLNWRVESSFDQKVHSNA